MRKLMNLMESAALVASTLKEDEKFASSTDKIKVIDEVMQGGGFKSFQGLFKSQGYDKVVPNHNILHYNFDGKDVNAFIEFDNNTDVLSVRLAVSSQTMSYATISNEMKSVGQVTAGSDGLTLELGKLEFFDGDNTAVSNKVGKFIKLFPDNKSN